jgi:hypothetical protein
MKHSSCPCYSPIPPHRQPASGQSRRIHFSVMLIAPSLRASHAVGMNGHKAAKVAN